MASSAQIAKTVARTAKMAVAALAKRTAANVPPDGMAHCVNCLAWREPMARDALAAANARAEDFATRAAGNAFARTGRNVPTIAQLDFMARIVHSLADRVAAMGDATNNLVGGSMIDVDELFLHCRHLPLPSRPFRRQMRPAMPSLDAWPKLPFGLPLLTRGCGEMRSADWQLQMPSWIPWPALSTPMPSWPFWGGLFAGM